MIVRQLVTFVTVDTIMNLKFRSSQNVVRDKLVIVIPPTV